MTSAVEHAKLKAVMKVRNTIIRWGVLLLGALLLLPSPLTAATEKDKEPRTAKKDKEAQKKEKKKSRKEAEQEKQATILYQKEMEALAKADAMLETVKSEKDAKEAVKKLTPMFVKLRPQCYASDKELESLAEAQNKVSARMNRLSKEKYFESAGLQKLWTIITDPLSRRRETYMK